MKKFLIIAAILTTGIITVSCSDHREPGRAYMPDMAYSRAYETYADHSELNHDGVNYSAQPVAGTIARGDIAHFPIAQDKFGDTINYIASRAVANPLTDISAADMKEAERLYLINCGICHGPKLDGNGPLWKGGDGAYPSAPKDLIGDPVVSKMPAGQLFYSITYGKNLMGSYASQLSTKQRWMVVAYVQSKQEVKAAPAETPSAADSTAAPATGAATK